MKTQLTPEDSVLAIYLYVHQGLDQDQIKAALGVTNVGRVNEAIMRMAKAARLRPDSGYKDQ